MRKASILAILALFAFLVGCGTSGGNDAASSDGTETTAAPDGTTAPDETTPSNDDDEDDEDDAPAEVSAEELEGILPVASDIGPDYYDDDSEDLEDESDDSDDSVDDDMAEACPELAALDTFGTGDDDNPDEVSAQFTTDDDRGVEVSLDPTPNDFTEENVGVLIDALSNCGTIETGDEASGMAISFKIDATELAGVGDFGVAMTMEGSFTMLGIPLQVDFQGNLFSVDGVLVSVTVSSGLDDTTFAPVPADYDLLDPLSFEMESRVESLTD